MTICAGFCSLGGVVLGADTQESAGVVKVSKTKIALRPKWPTGNDPWSAVFAGAGDATYTDMLTDELWSCIEKAGTQYSDIVEALKKHVRRSHSLYAKFSTADVRYEPDLLIGLWTKEENRARLFRAAGPAISEISDYACIGYGLDLGTYITARLFRSNMGHEAVEVIAAYLLSQVNRYNNFCGGESEIVTLHHEGNVEYVHGIDVFALGRFFSDFDDAFRDALLPMAMESSPISLEEIRDRLGDQLTHMRERLLKFMEMKEPPKLPQKQD